MALYFQGEYHHVVRRDRQRPDDPVRIVVLLHARGHRPAHPALASAPPLRSQPWRSRGEAARTGVSGAGLGLAIVERLLKHVGGALRMLPREGGGLTARIELPKAKFRNYQLDNDNP